MSNSNMDLDIPDAFFPFELGLTAEHLSPQSYNHTSPLSMLSNADHLSPQSYNPASPLQMISESSATHFSSSFNPLHEVQTHRHHVPTSPMNIVPSAFQSPSPISPPTDMSSFGSSRQSLIGSMHGQSALTQRLRGNPQVLPSSPVVTQPMNSMLNYDNMGGRQMAVSSSVPHYSPMNFGFPLNHDQMLSKQMDLTEYGIKAFETQDTWPTTGSLNNYNTGAVQIPNVPHRRTGSFTSSLGTGGSHRHDPYSRRPPSLAFSHGTPDLVMSSPLEPVVTMPTSSSLTSEPSPIATSTGFTPEQIPAAQAIVQFITEHPGVKIPAALITKELVEASELGKGYCLIGNCGIVRARQKMDPLYDPSTDKEYRKRTDHLLDHVKDKHFNSRPFVCGHHGCHAAFAREADLKRHGEIHSGLKIICPDQTCGKSYTRPDNLGRHIKQKHPNSPFAHSLPTNSHIRHSTTLY